MSPTATLVAAGGSSSNHSCVCTRITDATAQLEAGAAVVYDEQQ